MDDLTEKLEAAAQAAAGVGRDSDSLMDLIEALAEETRAYIDERVGPVAFAASALEAKVAALEARLK